MDKLTLAMNTNMEKYFFCEKSKEYGKVPIKYYKFWRF
jgi:hypothetical protein